MEPIRQTITILSICNKVFRTVFLKSDSVGIIPRGGTELGIASLLRLFMAGLLWSDRNKVAHAGNGREVRLARVPNVNVDG